MSIFSRVFSDKAEKKINKWRNELIELLPNMLEDEDDFGVDDEGDLHILKGSAHVFVDFGVDDDGDGWVTIHSPLVRLPKENLLPFYRRLLDLNNEPFLFGSLSTTGDIVVLTRTIPVDGLEEDAFVYNVQKLCFEADDIDDLLITEFEAPRFSFNDA